MAADPLRRRMYGNVCTPLERTEKISSHSEGVVDHHAYALALGHLHNRLIIRDIECRISEVFEVYSLGAAVHERLEVFDAVALGEAHFYAHVTKGDGEHGECASVEERLCHDVVAGAADVCDRKEHRRLARCCRNSRYTAFEGRHSLFEDFVGGVGDSCVYVARALELEEFGAVLHVVKCICSALVYRNCRSF